jgi:2-dehydropantoate 2-reductase
MRIIIYGVGAIGGVLAVSLKRSGTEVLGIARGRQLEAIRENGLLLRTPDGDHRAHFPCHADPTEIEFRPDDAILMTMKTQDTQPALERLRAAGVTDQPIFCVQNGVANEEMALRLFPTVFGVVVGMPATYMQPGEVIDFFTPKLGIFEIGRYGAGSDAVARTIAPLLEAADMAVFLHDDIMAFKYAKLIMNMGNAVDAVIPDETKSRRYTEVAREEARAVLAAAGIEPATLDRPERKGLATMKDIAGADRVGSSSAQSVARGAGSIETDYLNGEIVLLGRKYGVPTPVNTLFAGLAHRVVRNGGAPISADELDELLAPLGV